MNGFLNYFFWQIYLKPVEHAFVDLLGRTVVEITWRSPRVTTG